jgi:16S rRNA (guanine527-N7)-methyltransferase
VLPLARLAPQGPLLDLGSGNGSPGLVLALLLPGLAVRLAEPRLRRWGFLREAARACGRPDVEVLRVRHDAVPGPPAASLTLRALRLPLAELVPLVRPGGRLYVLGEPPAPAAPFVLESRQPGGLSVLRREAAGSCST